MFGGDDDFFDIFPDIDADGDHDIADFLILDGINKEIQREVDEGEAEASSVDDGEDDLEYVDTEDYESPEDYEEATDSDDFDSISIPLSFSIEVSYPGKEQLEKIKEEDYPNKRTYDAAYALCDIEYGEPIIPPGTTKEEEAERCRFVLSQSCVAARYLTQNYGFLFVQAVKDNFRLPIDVPDEDDEIKNFFPDFIMELAEEDVGLAVDVWAWCIKEFGAYQNYMDSTWTLYNHVLSSIDDYPDEFTDCLIDRLGSDQDFRRGLLTECPDTPWCIPELIVRALQTDREKIAQAIYIAAMKNPKSKGKWAEETLKSIISNCSNWEEIETIESFKQHILPIAEKIEDKRLQRVLPKLVQRVDEYIRCVEPSREARQGCGEAVKIASEVETQVVEEPRDPEPADTKIYRFCKVSLDYPCKPHYYYFCGDISLRVGDRVVVPLGQDNALKEGVVMSVGECMGCSFPCKADSIKYVHHVHSKEGTL